MVDMKQEQSWRILHIDDDKEDYLLARAMLAEVREPKIEIEWAASYEDGRAKLDASLYDAVLVDYDLGAETGLQIIEEFSPRYPAPLILYTGRGSRDVDREALAAGATLYLTKDEVNPLLLERGIRYAVQLKQRENDLLHANQRLEQELAERRRAEAALQASENKFSIYFGRSAFPSSVLKVPEGALVEVNEAWVAALGFSREEALGKTMLELGINPDAEAKARLAAVLRENGSARGVEMRLRTKNGEWRDFLINLDLIEIDDQMYVINSAQDITGRKRAEQALLESEARWQEFLDSTHDNYIALDRSWRFTYANRHYSEIMGLEPGELIGKNYWELFPQYIGTELEQNYRNVMEGGSPLHYRQGGIYTHRMYDVSVYPTSEGLAIFSIDRTEELHYQQQVEDERARLQDVLQAMPVAVWIADATGKLVFKNDQADRIWGGNAPLSENIEGYGDYVAWHLDNGEPVAAEEFPVAQALRTGQLGQPAELRIQRFDGTLGIVLAIGAPIKDREGHPAGAVAINVDLTETKKAEQALSESEISFRQLADAMPQLVWTALPDGTVDYYNQRHELYSGIGKTEPGHWNWGPVLHPDDLQPTMETWERAIWTGNVYQIEHRVKMADGTFRWHLSRGIPARGKDGQIVRWYGTATDIHDQKLVEQELRFSYSRLRIFLDANMMGTILGKVDGTLIEMNDYCLHLLGYSREDFQAGRVNWRAITAPEYLPAYEKAMTELVEQGQTAPYEKQYVRKDGQRVWVYVSNASLPDGTIAAIVLDITDRKQVERDLEHYTRELERSNQALQEFTSIASHDLQEPLHKITAFGELLSARYAELLDEQGKDYLARINSAAGRMSVMIQDLLTYSRITTRADEFTGVNLNEIAAEVLSDLEIRIEETGGRVQVGELPKLQADPLQMRQLFQNLIGNGLKYHRPGIAPVVEISAERKSRQWVIAVRDNGIGIDPRYTERIFEPFARLHTRSAYEGTGMGLAICKKIVERHGGTIEVHSQPGQGATFFIHLPAG